MATFRHGVNLGGWLSQCEERAKHLHYGSFIIKDDISRIADWGFDHVRLPVDCTVFTQADGAYDMDVLAYIDQCLFWCQNAGLGLQLDMHRLPGYHIASPKQNDLFVSAPHIAATRALWAMLAKRLMHAGAELRFELLNEPEWPCVYPVNDFYADLIAHIRAIDPKRVLVVGGNHYSHVDALESLRTYPDPAIVYTFHYYEPNLFTNQLYHHSRGDMSGFQHPVAYPGMIAHLRPYLDEHPEKADENGRYCWIPNDRALIHKHLQKACDFQNYHQCTAYMGEFGVSYYAQSDVRCAWLRDVLAFANDNRIDWCYWTYKDMDYGLLNSAGKVISWDVINTLQAGCKG